MDVSPSEGGGSGFLPRWLDIGLFPLGIAALLVSLTASGTLITSHLSAMEIPGCGAGGGCAALSNSVFGKLPYVGTSVSVLGFAFFAGALVGWIASWKRPWTPFRWFARIGAAISIFYLGVLATKVADCAPSGDCFCPYCFAAHMGNLAFLLCAELRGIGRPRPSRPFMPAIAAVVAMVVVGAGLGGFERFRAQQIIENENKEADEELERILEGADESGGSGTFDPGSMEQGEWEQ